MLKTMSSSLFRCCMALLAFAALNVLTPSDVFAQNANDGGGTVSGVVTDDQGPVIGAAVMIKDGQGGVTKSQTDAVNKKLLTLASKIFLMAKIV